MLQLRLYMSAEAQAKFGQGEQTIFTRLASAFATVGFAVTAEVDGEAARLNARKLRDYAIFQMAEPPNSRALCLRRAYQYPFWRLENTNERWRFDVALADYDPHSIDPVPARPFCNRWRHKLTAGRNATREGFIFMPLQGRLLDHRSFQSQSPLQMIETTLSSDPNRPIVATLHPGETYGPDELAALEGLVRLYPSFRLAANSVGLLEACDYVVTQNSTMAFAGYLFGKRPVLFAGSDFHHIAASVPHIGVSEAFRLVQDPLPDPALYLYWFWQLQSLNAGRDDITAQILARAARHGWPVSGQ